MIYSHDIFSSKIKCFLYFNSFSFFRVSFEILYDEKIWREEEDGRRGRKGWKERKKRMEREEEEEWKERKKEDLNYLIRRYIFIGY